MCPTRRDGTKQGGAMARLTIHWLPTSCGQLDIVNGVLASASESHSSISSLPTDPSQVFRQTPWAVLALSPRAPTPGLEPPIIHTQSSAKPISKLI